MANAKPRTRKVEKIVVEEIPDGVTLDLTATEAQTLYDIMRSVGGSPSQTRRGYAENILLALHDVGIRKDERESEDKNGNIFFDELSDNDPRRKDLPTVDTRGARIHRTFY